MTHTTRSAIPLLILVAAGLPACASVHDVRDPRHVVVEESYAFVGEDTIPARETTVVRDDPADEANKRRWLEENYGPHRAPPAREVVVRDRYVPAREPVRERVIVVDREPRCYVPPVSIGLGFGWWRGHHHHGHGWGLGFGW